MKKISVIIVDDHPLFRQGVCLYFKNNNEIEIIKELADGQEAIDYLNNHYQQVDVVLMDLNMPGLNGQQATFKICEKWPEIRILVLTSYGSWDKVYPLLNSGAAGYLLKDAHPDELKTAIKAVSNGGAYFEKKIAAELIKNIHNEEKIIEKDDETNDNSQNTNDDKEEIFSELIEPLTDREREVLKLIGKGKGNSGIAEELYISNNTVKTHVSNIFQKLGVKSRTQAAFYALDKGLIG